MAKKKTKNKVGNIEEQFEQEFGQDIIVTGQYVADAPTTIVSVSPHIDLMLGGGVPFGSFVIPTGKPKMGKTSMALNLAANALAIDSEWGFDRELYFFNIEGRLNRRDLIGVEKLRPFLKDRVKVIGSIPGKILTAEDYLNMGEQLINEKPGCIFIFDSFSQLCSKAGREKEWDGDNFRDNVPNFLSLWCKRIANVIPVNKGIVVGITHLIADTGFGFNSWAEASGNKIQYQVDVKLKAWANDWKEGETVVGKKVNWDCFCAPLLNGECETKCESKLRYGYGIDDIQELLEVAVDLRIIKKAGAWLTFPDDSQAQGMAKARRLLAENKELLETINKQYRETMGLPDAGVRLEWATEQVEDEGEGSS